MESGGSRGGSRALEALELTLEARSGRTLEPLESTLESSSAWALESSSSWALEASLEALSLEGTGMGSCGQSVTSSQVVHCMGHAIEGHLKICRIISEYKFSDVMMAMIIMIITWEPTLAETTARLATKQREEYMIDPEE